MSALNDLYSQYAPDVYRFALGLCGDPAWAEDITSETFVRAIVSPTSIRAETAKAYLFYYCQKSLSKSLAQSSTILAFGRGHGNSLS